MPGGWGQRLACTESVPGQPGPVGRIPKALLKNSWGEAQLFRDVSIQGKLPVMTTGAFLSSPYITFCVPAHSHVLKVLAEMSWPQALLTLGCFLK